MNITQVWEAVGCITAQFDTGEGLLSFYHQMNKREPRVNILDALNSLCKAYKIMGELIDYDIQNRCFERDGFREGVISLSVVDKDGTLGANMFKWENVE